ncbi:MAG TPA: hypothetical protein VHD36_05595 [Pirellulales bacterium]|nr:hypothetical protein [Pirellulales bacterium]
MPELLAPVAQHPAVRAVYEMLEPWRAGIAEVTEILFGDYAPDDPDDASDDVMLFIRPRNPCAAPVEVHVYAAETDRVDVVIDRWSHVARVLGVAYPFRKKTIDYYVCGGFGFVTLDHARSVIEAAARGDIRVTGAFLRGRLRGTTVTLRWPDGSKSTGSMGMAASARLLSVVGLAEMKSFQYEPWHTD